MKCQAWGRSPEIIEKYFPIIRNFGANAEMREWAEGFVGSHSGRCLWDAQFLTKNYIFNNCINIGGAPFLFEYAVKKLRPQIDVVSVDLGADRFPLVEEILDITVIQLDIEGREEEYESITKKYECLVLCEVFEHLRIDIIKTITLLSKLLEDNGIIYITTPNGAGLSALRNLLLHRRTGPEPLVEWSKLHKIGHMGHVREYSFPEIRDVLTYCGFSVERCFFRRMRYESRLPEYLTGAVTWLAPSLGDELVIVARRTAHSA